MSLDATRWAWQQQALKPSTKLVLLSFADRASESHECYPSIRRLEADTGLHRQTIHSAIKELEMVGLLAVDRDTGRHNKYGLIGVKDRHENQSEKPNQYENPTRAVKRTKPVRKDTPDQYEKPPTESTNEPSNESTGGKTRRKQLPHDFVVTTEMCDWAATKHPLIDLASATEQFTDYHLSKGSVFADWDRAWRNWIANETKFGRRGSPQNGQRKRSPRDDFQREVDEMLGISPGGANGDSDVLAEREVGPAGLDRRLGQRTGRSEA